MDAELKSPQERLAEIVAESKPHKARKGGSRHFEWEHCIRRHWLPRLTRTEALVCFALNSRRDPDGTVLASHGTLGGDCGIRREHAARTTAKLERMGLLKVVERGRTIGKHGKRTCNVYRLVCALPPPPNSACGGTIVVCE